MRLDFQKNIASSQFTLPIVSIISMPLWVFLPISHTANIQPLEHGLWHFVPSTYLPDETALFISIGVAALGVYLLAELNNSHVLLRISSRLLSSIFALLLGITLCLHTVHPGQITMVSTLLSFFVLFYSYQTTQPLYPFITFMFLSMGSLVFPKLLYMIPIYWVCLIHLRSLSLRSFIASILGALVPYWVVLGILVNIEGGYVHFLDMCNQVIIFERPDYTSLHITDISIFAFTIVLLMSGIINFYRTNFNDKTRVRIIYNAIIMHSVAVILFMSLQPQYFHTLFPILLIDASILGGHFLALTYNRFTHIYCIIMSIAMIALTIMQLIL